MNVGVVCCSPVQSILITHLNIMRLIYLIFTASTIAVICWIWDTSSSSDYIQNSPQRYIRKRTSRTYSKFSKEDGIHMFVARVLIVFVIMINFCQLIFYIFWLQIIVYSVLFRGLSFVLCARLSSYPRQAAILVQEPSSFILA